MNNNITEDYCSFEVSKLLKEKGFKRMESVWFDKRGNEFYYTELNGIEDEQKMIPRPTHALAIKWI